MKSTMSVTKDLMLRVSAATHAQIKAMQERRELARSNGQVICSKDAMTIDETIRYLLKVEADLQSRRLRARKRRTSRQSPQHACVPPEA